MWLANRLFPSVRRLQARLAQAEARAGAGKADELNPFDGGLDARGQYRATWQALSKTDESARQSIIGNADIALFESLAAADLAVLQRTVGLQSSDDVLEIGCGAGRLGKLVAPLVRSWTGCDVSENMLTLAKERVGGQTNVRLALVSGNSLAEIADASIDLVYCAVVFMHIWEFDRFSYVLDAYRVLRPRGRIYIDNLTLCSDLGWQMFERDRLSYTAGNRPPHISTYSTPQELEAYLLRAGFREIESSIDGKWLRAWAVK